MDIHLSCPKCGNQSARKLYYGARGVGCDMCWRSDGRPRNNGVLHTYANDYHKGLSVAKERVFDRSYIEPRSGEVLDRDTGKEAAY